VVDGMLAMLQPDVGYRLAHHADLDWEPQLDVAEVQPGVVIGHAKVDFDQLKAGKNSYNPLLSVFSGIHDVVVTTQAHGAHGQGFVHVDSVSLDGVEVPQFALEMFVDKYLQPKYPYLGIDSRFALPERVDSATAGQHNVTLTQK